MTCKFRSQPQNHHNKPHVKPEAERGTILQKHVHRQEAEAEEAEAVAQHRTELVYYDKLRMRK